MSPCRCGAGLGGRQPLPARSKADSSASSPTNFPVACAVTPPSKEQQQNRGFDSVGNGRFDDAATSIGSAVRHTSTCRDAQHTGRAARRVRLLQLSVIRDRQPRSTPRKGAIAQHTHTGDSPMAAPTARRGGHTGTVRRRTVVLSGYLRRMRTSRRQTINSATVGATTPESTPRTRRSPAARTWHSAPCTAPKSCRRPSHPSGSSARSSRSPSARVGRRGS